MTKQDHAIATRNMVIVGFSLIATWSVALVVRMILPRRLGPSAFGEYNFAEALASTGFAFVGLGIDNYIQKEIPNRPEHASDFYGGTQIVRAFAGLLVIGVIAFIAHRSGYGREVVLATICFGFSYLCLYVANTSATLLYAARRVERLSVLNITTKLLWAAGVTAALLYRAQLWAFALAAVMGELVRLVGLFVTTRKMLALEVRIDLPETLRVLGKSMPYYLNVIAIVLYSKIDMTIMGVLLPNRELGFYGAATNISSIAMLMTPMMNWVVTPQLARSAHDRAELIGMVRRSLEWTIVLALPIALMLELSADVVIQTVFGAQFGPATGAMRALAPVFVLVYAAMLAATGLMLLERAWTVTLVTASSFVVNAVLNVLMVRPAFAWLGEGGGGVGAAAITVFTEAVVVAIYVGMLGRDVFDRASLGAIARSLGVCAAVAGLHMLLRPLGPARLAIDVVVYVGLAVVTRAIRVGELYPLLLAGWRSRKSHANS